MRKSPNDAAEFKCAFSKGMETCLSPYNRIGLDPTLPEEVILCDVTLRDGEQTPGVAFSLEEKVDLARRISALGIPQIQMGNAGGSADARQEAETICRLGLASKIEVMTTGTSDHWRRDVDAALACGADIVHSLMPASAYMRNMYGNMPESALLKRAEEIITYARKSGAKIINISILDATRTEEALLLEMIRVLGEVEADRIRIADTVGTATPEGIFYLVRRAREALSALPRPPIIGLHCHNDFGLALANVFAGVKAGARLIDVTLNGLGERSGNPSLVEVAVGLEALYGVPTHIRLEGLYEISKYAEKISGLPLPTNKPFIGEYVFADQSDNHVKAVLEDPWAFQGIRPESLGNRRQFIIGKRTGENILAHKIRELKLDVPPEEFPRILARIRALSLQSKGKVLTDADLVEMIRRP